MSTQKEVVTLDLSSFGKVSKSKGLNDPLSSNREASAYKMLQTEGISLKSFCENPITIKHGTFKYHNGHFIVSLNKNIQYADKDTLQLLIDRKATAPDTDVFEGSIDSAEQIFNLFFNKETAPRTKCHSYWFGLTDNKAVFCALQGDSIKICR